MIINEIGIDERFITHLRSNRRLMLGPGIVGTVEFVPDSEGRTTVVITSRFGNELAPAFFFDRFDRFALESARATARWNRSAGR
jgi:hypothetical protein